MKPETGRQFNTRISPEDKACLDAGAFVNGVTVPQFIRDAIDERVHQIAQTTCERLILGEQEPSDPVMNFLSHYLSFYGAETSKESPQT